MSAPEAIYHDRRLAEAYDELNPWSAADDFYRALAVASGGPVLDIGCGTGTFACRLADEDGLDVSGLDPAPAMLRVARAKPEGRLVTWIDGDGCSADLGRRFRFIVMTGHAFQALRGEEEMAALLANVARLLAPDGRFAFETRNPAAREWLEWTPKETTERPAASRCGLVENWHDHSADPPGPEGSVVVRLTTGFRFVDPPLETTGESTLHFISKDRLAASIESAGLFVERWYGGFDREPCEGDCRELVAIARLA